SASRDFYYSIMAVMIYNGVLQFVVYPMMNRLWGADIAGNVLYLLSIVSIMGASFGTGASYSRMVAKSERTQANGDYNIFLLIIFALSVLVSLAALVIIGNFGFLNYLQLFILMIFTVVRYYSDVEFRMTIRFKEYFIFFLTIALGYALGSFLTGFMGFGVDVSAIDKLGNPLLTGMWTFPILAGEILAVVYVFFNGKILRKPFFEHSDSYNENIKSAFMLSGSNLVANIVLNSDRVLVRWFVGAGEVVTFYSATLVGKMVAMLTAPLNGVIISYLTGYDLKLTRKRLGIISLLLALVSIAAAIGSTVVSYIFVKLMYPDIFDAARQYFLVANLGQVLYFISGSLMVIILKMTGEKLQLVISIIYAVLFLVIVVPMTYFSGLWGIAWGLLIINVARFLIVMFLGLLSKNIG
ncbi:MAG: hypothetical protein K6A23_05450, partial [Butyrivibrio sp.]|nr:hypothetical protein [Butyrivibrio sp.]